MAAWRSAVKVLRFSVRHARSHGLRTWRAFVQERWKIRRRGAITQLLSERHLKRAAFMEWQIHCFLGLDRGDRARGLGEAVAAGNLVDRWSDAVADQDVVRPLIMLCG